MHGQGTSKLSFINPKLVALTPSDSSAFGNNMPFHLLLNFVFIKYRKNSAKILKQSSKHSGSFIPSLGKNTYAITLILPNRNISINILCSLPCFHSLKNVPQSRKLLDRSSKSSSPMQQPRPHNPSEQNHSTLH